MIMKKEEKEKAIKIFDCLTDLVNFGLSVDDIKPIAAKIQAEKEVKNLASGLLNAWLFKNGIINS